MARKKKQEVPAKPATAVNNPPTTPSPRHPIISQTLWDDGSATVHAYVDQPIQIDDDVPSEVTAWFGGMRYACDNITLETRSSTPSKLVMTFSNASPEEHPDALEYNGTTPAWASIASGLAIEPFSMELPYGP